MKRRTKTPDGSVYVAVNAAYHAHYGPWRYGSIISSDDPRFDAIEPRTFTPPTVSTLDGDTDIVVAVRSAVLPGQFKIVRGDPIAADHPAVAANPDAFTTFTPPDLTKEPPTPWRDT